MTTPDAYRRAESEGRLLGMPADPARGQPARPLPASLDVDVLVIGSGAGGGITAEALARAGLSVLVVEEGPLRTPQDFRQLESEAYPTLYQESAGRKTADKGITVLQGRCVGGSTTVNWTSSFRTPTDTLAHWHRRWGLDDATPTALQPWFEQVETRLGIGDWTVEPNRNNALLAQGLAQLGWSSGRIRRNVKGCWNLGSCGLGCPTGAKQSMAETTLPSALEAGARLFVQTRAQRLVHNGRHVQAVDCVPVTLNGTRATGTGCRVTARHVVLAGGALNSPALLLRSQAPDPFDRLGRRTFLHPTAISRAQFDAPVDGWAGAPQTVYSDHFLHQHPLEGPLGYKLEVPPLHPLIGATTLTGMGTAHMASLREFPHTQAVLALLRDGFHPDSPGGRVRLQSDGSPLLDYPFTPALQDGLRRALWSMAELQFAAGARNVQPVHEDAGVYTRWTEARTAIANLPMAPLRLRVVSAHALGGCAQGADPSRSVCRPDGRHWQLKNLSVHDGSLFPTSLGANPQLSIYAWTARLSAGLLAQWPAG